MQYLPRLEYKGVRSEQVELILVWGLVWHDGEKNVRLYQVVKATHVLKTGQILDE